MNCRELISHYGLDCSVTVNESLPLYRQYSDQCSKLSSIQRRCVGLISNYQIGVNSVYQKEISGNTDRILWTMAYECLHLSVFHEKPFRIRVSSFSFKDTAWPNWFPLRSPQRQHNSWGSFSFILSSTEVLQSILFSIETSHRFLDHRVESNRVFFHIQYSFLWCCETVDSRHEQYRVFPYPS